jgi:hypothetical protein
VSALLFIVRPRFPRSSSPFELLTVAREELAEKGGNQRRVKISTDPDLVDVTVPEPPRY